MSFKINDPIQSTKDEPTNEIIEEQTDEIIEEPTNEIIEEQTDEIIEEPTNEIIEEPTDEIIEEPTDEIIEEPTDEIIEEPTDEITKNQLNIFDYIKNSKKYLIDLCDKNNKFYDKIDLKKFDYVLQNFKSIEPLLKKDIEDDRKKFKKHSNYNYETTLNNIKNNIVILPHLNNTPYGYIRTEYNKGEKCNNKGRAYV